MAHDQSYGSLSEAAPPLARTQRSLGAVESDDEEITARGDFGDRFRGDAIDGIVQGTDQITKPVDRSLGHIFILSEY